MSRDSIHSLERHPVSFVLSRLCVHSRAALLTYHSYIANQFSTTGDHSRGRIRGIESDQHSEEIDGGMPVSITCQATSSIHPANAQTTLAQDAMVTRSKLASSRMFIDGASSFRSAIEVCLASCTDVSDMEDSSHHCRQQSECQGALCNDRMCARSTVGLVCDQHSFPSHPRQAASVRARPFCSTRASSLR